MLIVKSATFRTSLRAGARWSAPSKLTYRYAAGRRFYASGQDRETLRDFLDSNLERILRILIFLLVCSYGTTKATTSMSVLTNDLGQSAEIKRNHDGHGDDGIHNSPHGHTPGQDGPVEPAQDRGERGHKQTSSEEAQQAPSAEGNMTENEGRGQFISRFHSR